MHHFIWNIKVNHCWTALGAAHLISKGSFLAPLILTMLLSFKLLIILLQYMSFCYNALISPYKFIALSHCFCMFIQCWNYWMVQTNYYTMHWARYFSRFFLWRWQALNIIQYFETYEYFTEPDQSLEQLTAVANQTTHLPAILSYHLLCWYRKFRYYHHRRPIWSSLCKACSGTKKNQKDL